MTIFPDKIDDQRGDFFLSVQNHRALAVPWISPSSTGPIAVEGDCEDIIIPYDVSFMDDSVTRNLSVWTNRRSIRYLRKS